MHDGDRASDGGPAARIEVKPIVDVTADQGAPGRDVVTVLHRDVGGASGSGRRDHLHAPRIHGRDVSLWDLVRPEPDADVALEPIAANDDERSTRKRAVRR